MKLIYHPNSPYSRKAYILALERGVADRIQLHQVVVCPIPYPGWSDNNSEVAEHNPITKIPTLVLSDDAVDSQQHANGPNGVSLFDSRVICDYIDSLAATQTLDATDANLWINRTIHACADGICDAEVLVVYEDKIRTDLNLRFQTWVDGMRTKIRQGLDFLDRAAQKGQLRTRAQNESVSTAEVACVIALNFMDERDVDWRKGRAGLEAWFDKTWKGRRSFVETNPKVDWKAGEGKGRL